MKRMVSLVLLMAFLGALAGCATDTDYKRTKLPGIDDKAPKKEECAKEK